MCRWVAHVQDETNVIEMLLLCIYDHAQLGKAMNLYLLH